MSMNPESRPENVLEVDEDEVKKQREALESQAVPRYPGAEVPGGTSDEAPAQGVHGDQDEASLDKGYEAHNDEQ